MAKFQIQRTQRGLPSTSGSVRATFDPATNAGAVGQAVGEFGVALGSKIKQRTEEREKIRNAIEIKNRKNLDVRETRKAGLSKEDFLRDVEDIKSALPPERWADAIGERGTQYKTETDTLDLSPEARESLNIEIGGTSRRVEDEAFADGSRRLRDTAIETTKESLVGLFRVGRPPREDLRKQVEILRFNGLGAEEIVAMISTAKDAGEKLRNEDSIEAKRSEIALSPEASKVELETELALRKDGKGEIPEDELSSDDISKLINLSDSTIAGRKGRINDELEALREEQLADINKLIYETKDYNAATRATLDSNIAESDKRVILNNIDSKASAAAKGVPVENDRVEENRLMNLSLDIWTGKTTKKEFDKDLTNNAHKLDDEAFKRVSASASTTLKTSQAQDLSRANTEAMRQLVDFQTQDAMDKFISDSIAGLSPKESDAFKSEANEIRQAQFRELSNFNAELREWIAQNPDKTGKEFFQFSRGLENQYRLAKQSDTTVQQLRADAEPQTVITQEEYDKLPSGTRYIDANGNASTKR